MTEFYDNGNANPEVPVGSEFWPDPWTRGARYNLLVDGKYYYTAGQPHYATPTPTVSAPTPQPEPSPLRPTLQQVQKVLTIDPPPNKVVSQPPVVAPEGFRENVKTQLQRMLDQLPRWYLPPRRRKKRASYFL